MATDHARNMEALTRPAIGLGLAVAMPLMGVFAPFIVIGIVLFAAYVAMNWTWAAAMLPLVANDEILSDLLTTRFGAKSAIWGACALLAACYVAVGGWGWFYRNWPVLNLRLAGALVAAYAGFVLVSGLVFGTHFPSQVAYAWSNPSKNATLAWNCPASLSSGKAAATGRYDLVQCRFYVDEAAINQACRQVMREMRPLNGPQFICDGPIKKMTKHEWPMEGRTYVEWDRSWKTPIHNPPLATPDLMRKILAEQGLTPAAR